MAERPLYCVPLYLRLFEFFAAILFVPPIALEACSRHRGWKPLATYVFFFNAGTKSRQALCQVRLANISIGHGNALFHSRRSFSG